VSPLKKNEMRGILAIAVLCSVIISPCFGQDGHSIKGTWDPLSHVFLNFGKMTLSDKTIVWAEGQKSACKVIKNEKSGIVIELTNSPLPKFHGTPYKFIRFRVNNSSTMTGKRELEVSFYEASNTTFDDNYSMWGFYVASMPD